MYVGVPKCLHLFNIQILNDNRLVSHKSDHVLKTKEVAIFVG